MNPAFAYFGGKAGMAPHILRAAAGAARPWCLNRQPVTGAISG